MPYPNRAVNGSAVGGADAERTGVTFACEWDDDGPNPNALRVSAGVKLRLAVGTLGYNPPIPTLTPYPLL